MGLSRLEINNIRNLQPVRIDLNPGFNCLCGSNGSGKTSILEALYILGRGTSFRTNDLSRVLQYGAQRFYVSGKLEVSNLSLGVEYQAKGLQLRVAGQQGRSRLELAMHLPLLFISPESHSLIIEGPQHRRRYLDWGVFHVEQGFLPVWRRYQRALKQRNKALGTPGLDMAWDGELIHAAEQITELRRNYIAKLETYVDQYVHRLVELENVTINYLPGWRQDLSYTEVLRASLLQDREYGFTRHGPHRAEVVVKIGNRLARDSISRGQQKLLVIALLLAQVALLNEVAFIKPVILIDDLTAELDPYHRNRLLDVLSSLKAQTIMTVTEESALPANNETPIRWFHVEHGKVKEG